VGDLLIDDFGSIDEHECTGLGVRGRGGDAKIVDVQAYDCCGNSLSDVIHDRFEHSPKLVRSRRAACCDAPGRVEGFGYGPPVGEPSWPLVGPQGHAEKGWRILDRFSRSHEIVMGDVLVCLVKIQ
jgi:hypothetical protein